MAKPLARARKNPGVNCGQWKVGVDTIFKGLSLEDFSGSAGSSGKLNDLVMRDELEQKQSDLSISWYHGKISRDVTEKLLKQAPQGDGHFLVRDSSTSPGHYVISLKYKDSIMYFQVTKCEEQVYCIDEGPHMEGLEKLIKYYQSMDMGLPSKLTTFCQCMPPPQCSVRYGRTNILHYGVKTGNLMLVKSILSHSHCPDINGKDADGSTVLHEASLQGNEDIVFHLLQLDKINVNAKDAEGFTSLHKACIANKPKIIEMLMLKGGAEPQERSTNNGWVPLHEAASRGNTQCVKVLLSCNAPCRPRNDAKETPRDLALKNKHAICVEILENYRAPPAKTKRDIWLHEQLDRKEAKKILQTHGMTDGLFVVRKSSKHQGRFVVALVYGGSTYNYEIRNEDDKVFYIDDGPFLESLEHVIEHYSIRADGLPTRLITAVKLDGSLHHLNIPRPSLRDHPIDMKPTLPPRPQSLAQEMSSSANPDHTGDHSIKPPGGADKHGPTARKLPAPPMSPKPKLPTESSPAKSNPQPSLPSVASPHVAPPTVKPGLTIIATGCIHLSYELGQGEFGSVMKGKYKKPGAPVTDVAVKTLREEHMQTGKKEFLREAEVMCGLHHSCIVKLIGICEGPPMMLVQELVAMGSLLDYLLDYPQEINHPVDLYLWAAQIAFGMQYLENKKYVHRDLAARNILLASKTQVKISDFGLSRAVGTESDYYKASAGGRWPVKWYAPESINYGTFSHASDVWGYGVTLWEMFSYGEQPYGEMNGAQVIAWLERGKRLHPPENVKPCPHKVYEVMCKCWHAKASERPTFAELYGHFETEDEYASFKDIWSAR